MSVQSDRGIPADFEGSLPVEGSAPGARLLLVLLFLLLFGLPSWWLFGLLGLSIFLAAWWAAVVVGEVLTR